DRHCADDPEPPALLLALPRAVRRRGLRSARRAGARRETRRELPLRRETAGRAYRHRLARAGVFWAWLFLAFVRGASALLRRFAHLRRRASRLRVRRIHGCAGARAKERSTPAGPKNRFALPRPRRAARRRCPPRDRRPICARSPLESVYDAHRRRTAGI